MKPRRAELLAPTYPDSSPEDIIDNNQTGQVINTEVNIHTIDIQKKTAILQQKKVLKRLKNLIITLSHNPTLLTGPSRHLKVELHYREPRSKLIWPRQYHKTSKIRLTGNWISKAGFKQNERIRVIQMQRMLIILPETD
jgi:hypothetical protein